MPQNSAQTPHAQEPAEAAISHRETAGVIDRRISVAPMMDWTDRHCRYFLRGFSARTLLYTEMITAEALMRGNAERLLCHSPEEHPLALQLGGSSPARLAAAARIGAQAGYVEINLNCGCPSDRVHAGAFGACLMADPARVADCVAAMCAAVTIPVTVKMRIGVIDGTVARPIREHLASYDEQDYARLLEFTTLVHAAGCEVFIVHARQAVLGGLSPKENRDVPPLRPQVVQRLAAQLPGIQVILNGGLRSADQVIEALGWSDGVMLGREAYHRPYLLSEVHQQIFADGWQRPGEPELLERMAVYAERELAAGTPLAAITRHMLGLYARQSGARSYRQRLTLGVREPGSGSGVIRAAAVPMGGEPRVPVDA